MLAQQTQPELVITQTISEISLDCSINERIKTPPRTLFFQLSVVVDFS